jgi:glycosyltransferase involved in cell wall biosynthesis
VHISNMLNNQTSKPSISIVISAKDEEETLGEVVQACLPYADEILVVDGHSQDKTREIAEKLGCRVILDNGKGKGAAIRLGIQEVTGDIIVFIDADGSHDARDIPRLVAPILEGKADHVTASRMLGGSDELYGDFNQIIRLIGSCIIMLGINYRFNVRLTDSQNGFRAIRTEVARKLRLREEITSIEQEMIIKTLRAGFKMVEVSSHEYARKGGVSKINVLRVAPRYVYSWLKYVFFSW